MALFGGNTLFYPGCVTKFFLKDVLKNYEALLVSFGIEFVKLNEMEKCCGIEAYESGYTADFHEIMAKNEDLFREYKVKKVITNCPKCFRTFKEFYSVKPELLLNVILKNVDKLKRKEGEITYYDGAEFGRKLKVNDEPRQILKAVGFDLIELDDNRENTLSCGVGGGLERNSPRIANEIAKMVLKKVKTEVLVTADPICYKHLKENAVNVKVLELSEVLM